MRGVAALFRGAHATRVLVAATRRDDLVPNLKNSYYQKETEPTASRRRQHASRVRSPELS
jgi:hypothetical protein